MQYQLEDEEMNRRFFTSLCILFGPMAVLRQNLALAKVYEQDSADPIGALTSDRSMAAHLGAAYFAAADERRLSDTLRRLREVGPTRAAELREVLANLAQEDLARHDTVLVDGWVLARAEAEALALVHLARAS